MKVKNRQTEECLASAQVLPLCEAGVWRCPSCLDLCNCSGRSCSRFQKGLEPTEQLHSEAVRQGFKSVRAALLGIRSPPWWLPRSRSSGHACTRHGILSWVPKDQCCMQKLFVILYGPAQHDNSYLFQQMDLAARAQCHCHSCALQISRTQTEYHLIRSACSGGPLPCGDVTE